MDKPIMGLNRTQLKTIAILAMVCDHAAWGFLDFYTLGAQFLHLIGRLTLPIMCFFIAEGFRHTSHLKKYIIRLGCFWLASVIPFYLFFHKMYDFRQNILFDLLLGLLALTVLEHKTLSKTIKVLLTSLIFIISMWIGGWIILPILYILIFYYQKDFRSCTKWFCSVTILLVVFLVISISLNQIYHFSSYDWIWYDKLYLLGFMLALPLLKCYNKEKGGNEKYRYIFYLFYPLHFIALSILQQYAGTPDIYYFYLGIHLLVIVLFFGLLHAVSLSRPSKAQSINLTFMSFSIVYMVGFIIEITSSNLEALRIAIKIEYLGECLIMYALTWFISEFFRVRIPRWIYTIEILVSLFIMYCMLTLEHNQLFYTNIAIDSSGPFPRVALSYGFGFYFFLFYLGVICISAIILGFVCLKNSAGSERERIKYMILGFFCPWIAFIIQKTGITGGYEVSFLGILGIIICVNFAWIKYGYFDSVLLAGENALNHGKEGIMVVGTNYRILYFNQLIKEMFSNVSTNENAYQIDSIREILEGNIKSLEFQDKIYEMRVEPLKDAGYIQAYMLWAIDMTAHYTALKDMETAARTDVLTGLPNRSHFRSCLTQHIAGGGFGSMMMLDLDNFKLINDIHGHGIGDLVLITFSDVLTKASESTHLASRIGGDEFCMFFKNITDQKELIFIAEHIFASFEQKLCDLNLKDTTAASIGIAVCISLDCDPVEYFDNLYNKADKALYLAKNSGKGIYRFY